MNTCFSAQQNVFLSSQESQKNYFIETKKWFDGTLMTDGKVDGYIYKKNGSNYYVLDSYHNGSSVNAKFFGVKADGVTDDTKNLQKALDLAIKYGLTLVLPYGTIITTQDLIIDASSSKGKMRVLGSGMSNTVIKNIGNNTTNAIKITGNYFNNLELKDFRLERELSTPNPTGNIGLYIEKQVYASLENIEVIRFKSGIVMNDVSTLYMKRVHARFCGQGFHFARGINGASNPNLIEIHSCVLASNSEWGITFVNGHSVNIYSSLFEDNTLGGINFSYDGTNGSNSINLNGSYFEGNRGIDFYLKSSAGGTHNIIGNTFNRVDASKYTTNSIVFETVDQNSMQSENSLNMIGNGFFSANSYRAESSKKAVLIKSKNYKLINVFDSNIYYNKIETPAYHKEINLKN